MKLEDRLPNALDNLANTPPITDPGRFDPHQAIRAGDTEPSSGSRRLLAAAAAIATIGVGGLVVATNRSGTPPVADSEPAPQTSTVTLPSATPVTPGPDGALLFPPAAELRPISIQQGPIPSLEPVAWYATSAPQPEADTYFRVRSIDLGPASDTGALCVTGEVSATVSLADGTTACLEERDLAEDPTGTIQRRLGDYFVVIEGNASDDQLLSAAENLIAGPTPGSFGIEAAGLPDGVQPIATGVSISDFAYVETADANDDDMVSMISVGVDDETRSVFYLATRSDPGALGIHRLGFESVSDTTVRGQPGFIRTLENQPSYVGLVWHENGFTYQLGSQQFSQAELLDIVEQLAVPSLADWDTATASVPDIEQMDEERMDEERMDADVPTTTIILDQ